MIFLKIIGWIFLSIIAIVVVLLFIKVRIIAEYGINPSAKIKWLFIDLPLYPQPEKKSAKSKKKEKSGKTLIDDLTLDEATATAENVAATEENTTAETVAATQDNTTAEPAAVVQDNPTEQGKKASSADSVSLLKMFYRTNGGVEGIIQILKRVVSYLGTFLGGLLRSVVVTECCVDITVGTRDAAQTAIKYGEICTAAFPLLGSIVSKYRIRKYDFNIEPDFMAYKSEYGMYVDFYVRPAVILGRALALIFKLLFGVMCKVVFNMLRPILKQKADNKDKTKKKTEKSGATT